MKISCIIVDDEPLSQDVLEKYVKEHDQLELTAICSDAMEAGEVIRSNPVDLMFLDINMPGLSGLQFVKSLNNPPWIVFTTAYPEYAVEGFEVDAVDYLVKPFPFERFLRAVNKVFDKVNLSYNSKEDENILWLRSDKKLNRLNIKEISFIEAVGDYIKLYCEEGNLIIHETMQGILEKIKHNGFARVHRSYIVSIEKISYVEGNRISICERILPIGKAYREDFMKLIGKQN